MDVNAAIKITAGVAGQQALDKLNDSVKGLGSYAKTAGLALVGIGAGVSFDVLRDKFKSVVDGMAGLKDMAERTGSTVENMGALSRAAKLTGAEIGEVESGIIKMTRTLAGSDDAAKGAAHALSAIGLSASQLRALDPADAFKKIALALNDFEDGAGKTAISMAVLGKNGAQLLPFMKDMIELGDVVSKTTKEQAYEADAYNKNLLRLKATKEELYKTISVELLPVANAFVKALIDTSNNTNGLKTAAKGLAEDGSLKNVFMEGARAGAALLDVMSALMNVVSQIGSSFGVVWKDISTIVEYATKAPTAIFRHGGVEELGKIVADRNKYVEDANNALMARLTRSMTPYTDALEKQFANMGKSDVQIGGTRGKLTYQPLPSNTVSPYESELSTLGRDAAKFAFQNQHVKEYEEKINSARVAQLMFDTEFGKFKDLTEQQKKNLVEAAKLVDINSEALRKSLVALEYDKQSKAIELNTQLMGESNLVRDIATAKMELENKGIKEGTDLYNELIARRTEALTQAKEASMSSEVGFKQGMADIAQTVNDKAASMRSALVGAFNHASDALTDFVMTGKLGFSNFAQSVIRDLVAMIVKQQVFNAMQYGQKNAGSILGVFGFGGGGASPTPAEFLPSAGGVPAFANGGAFEGGRQAFASGGIVNTPTTFMFANGGAMKNGLMGEAGPEAIMPLRRGTDGRLGVSLGGTASSFQGVTVNVTVNAESGETTQDSQGKYAQLGGMIASGVRQELLNQKRPGGLLA